MKNTHVLCMEKKKCVLYVCVNSNMCVYCQKETCVLNLGSKTYCMEFLKIWLRHTFFGNAKWKKSASLRESAKVWRKFVYTQSTARTRCPLKTLSQKNTSPDTQRVIISKVWNRASAKWFRKIRNSASSPCAYFSIAFVRDPREIRLLIAGQTVFFPCIFFTTSVNCWNWGNWNYCTHCSTFNFCMSGKSTLLALSAWCRRARKSCCFFLSPTTWFSHAMHRHTACVWNSEPNCPEGKVASVLCVCSSSFCYFSATTTFSRHFLKRLKLLH